MCLFAFGYVGDAYTRQRTLPSFIRVMACRLLGTKTYLNQNPFIVYPEEQTSEKNDQHINIFFNENATVLSAIW